MDLSGGTKHSLAAAAAKKQGWVFFSILISISMSFLGSECMLFKYVILLLNSKRLIVANIYDPNEDEYRMSKEYF